MSFGVSIENGQARWGESFFSFECAFETIFDESFANVGNSIGVAMKLFGNIGIRNTPMFILIDREKDVGVLDFLGIVFAGGNDCLEVCSFFESQGYFVQLLHDNFLVGVKK